MGSSAGKNHSRARHTTTTGRILSGKPGTDSEFRKGGEIRSLAPVCGAFLAGKNTGDKIAGATALFAFFEQPHLEHRQKRLLRNLDAAHALHALLAFLLLLQQL